MHPEAHFDRTTTSLSNVKLLVHITLFSNPESDTFKNYQHFIVN